MCRGLNLKINDRYLSSFCWLFSYYFNTFNVLNISIRTSTTRMRCLTGIIVHSSHCFQSTISLKLNHQLKSNMYPFVYLFQLRQDHGTSNHKPFSSVYSSYSIWIFFVRDTSYLKTANTSDTNFLYVSLS